jgi:hypothetical protein
MIGRTQAQVAAAVVVAVFAVGIWASGGHLHSAWLRFYSISVTVLLILLGLWDRFLWRLPLAQALAGVPRNLRGTWRGELASHWVDPSIGTSPPTKTVYLVVRQTASAVTVSMLTDESASRSSFGRVTSASDEICLDYMYLNTPDNSLQHRSRIHHGSTSLKVSGKPAARLRGHYWTDRDSRGDLDFTLRTPKLADDFATAEALFQTASP